MSIRSTDDESKLQSDVNSAAMWSHWTELFFSEGKFVHVRFWPKPTFDPDTTTYTVNGKPIRQLSKHKDLGITFSSNLNWTDHYTMITTKAYQILGLVRRTSKISCIKAKKRLQILNLMHNASQGYGICNILFRCNFFFVFIALRKFKVVGYDYYTR